MDSFLDNVTACGFARELSSPEWLESNNVILHQVLYPILLSICLIGNGLTLIILPAGKQTTVTSVFLMAIAVADILVVLLNWDNWLPFIKPEIFEEKEDGSSVFADWYSQSYDALSWGRGTALQFSDWSLLAFSTIRLLSIVQPFKHRHFSRNRCIALEVALLIGASVFNIPVLLPDSDSDMSLGLVYRKAELTLTLVKWLLIVIFNAIIARTVCKNHRFMTSNHSSWTSVSSTTTEPATLHLSQPVTTARSESIAARNNRVLLGCALLYTLTQFPAVVHNTLLLAADKPFCALDYRASQRFQVATLTNTILLCNYTFNFAVYCLSSERYRRKVVSWFKGTRRPSVIP